MEVLNEENRQLFIEQVTDHVEKLNGLMGWRTGETFDENVIQRACLATKLLEGSTRMLSIQGWSQMLSLFRELLDRAVLSGTRWNESLSQVVSEVLELEERAVSELVAGETGAIHDRVTYEGLQCEIETLLSDTSCVNMEDIPSVRIEQCGDMDDSEMEAKRDGFSTLDKLIGSLYRVKDQFREFFDEGDRGERVQVEMENAFGESEFFISLLRDIIGKLGDRRKPFLSKVSCSTVFDGVQDFFNLHGRLRDWNADFQARHDDFTMEREFATTLAMILESCLFDVCTMYEANSEFRLSIEVDISNRGSYLVTTVSDNGPDFMSDSEIDRDDAVAFYKGLINVRSMLTKWGGLLWVEPDRGRQARFRFTIPRVSVKTDYRIFTSAGMKLAVPCHGLDTVRHPGEFEVIGEFRERFIDVDGVRVPVYRLDELAPQDADDGDARGSVLIIGLAEKRVGLFVDDEGKNIEGIQDQLTDGNWASLTRQCLHIGEEEYPVLDVQLIIDRSNYLQDLDSLPEESGYVACGSAFEASNNEVTVPRV